MSKKEISITDPEDCLRLRILQIRAQLPKGINYTPFYEQMFGEQKKDILHKIRMVWSLREVNEEITKNLEKMVEQIKIS